MEDILPSQGRTTVDTLQISVYVKKVAGVQIIGLPTGSDIGVCLVVQKRGKVPWVGR